MKITYFASVLGLVGVATFACDDSGDRVTPHHGAGSAGKSNVAGSSNGGSAGKGGGAGSANGGSAGSSSENVAGAAGSPEPSGGAAGENVGGEPNGNGGASEGGAAEGGAAGAGPVAPAPIELLGSYDDNYGGSFVITQTAWGDSAIAAYDNAADVVYTQFPANDPYSPNKFAKTVYTEPAAGSFYFCMVLFSADTLADAQASTETADATDPENGGCGGQFPWTKATKK